MIKKTKPVITIGSKENVDFPNLHIQGVLAKVDTGADSSSIWASNIKEENGELSYILFDRPHPFYSGKVIKTRDYSVSVVRNSFGHVEQRYKVKHKIILAGRSLITRFTLANRENNRMPILIGKRTIHGKFVVDVSISNPKTDNRVLIIDVKQSPLLRAFAEGIQAASIDRVISVVTYDDLIFSFGADGAKIINKLTNEDVANNDAIFFKSTSNKSYIAAAIAKYLQKRGTRFVDSAVANYPANSKLQQYILLADNNINIPKSIFVTNNQLIGNFSEFSHRLGLPFVLKDIVANNGENNFLISDEASFKKICKFAISENIQMIGQELIDNSGDYRVLVLGNKIGLIILRKRKSDSTHLNNVTKGAEAKLLESNELPGSILASCIIAAGIMEREVAGVDVLEDKKTGLWYCLEVNDSPQLSSGAFREAKQNALAKFLDMEMKR